MKNIHKILFGTFVIYLMISSACTKGETTPEKFPAAFVGTWKITSMVNPVWTQNTLVAMTDIGYKGPAEPMDVATGRRDADTVTIEMYKDLTSSFNNIPSIIVEGVLDSMPDLTWYLFLQVKNGNRLFILIDDTIDASDPSAVEAAAKNPANVAKMLDQATKQ